MLGSGYTFHNLPNFFHPTQESKQAARNFNEWLKETMLSSSSSKMKQCLKNWDHAPGAKQSHPREEHLIPLLITAAASDFTGAHVIYDTTKDADLEHVVTGYLFN
jgi:aromatic ring-opening dioxygenase catalytic subunit (LigB family)